MLCYDVTEFLPLGWRLTLWNFKAMDLNPHRAYLAWGAWWIQLSTSAQKTPVWSVQVGPLFTPGHRLCWNRELKLLQEGPKRILKTREPLPETSDSYSAFGEGAGRPIKFRLSVINNVWELAAVYVTTSSDVSPDGEDNSLPALWFSAFLNLISLVTGTKSLLEFS